MARHFIVTCGTSQLREDYLEQVGCEPDALAGLGPLDGDAPIRDSRATLLARSAEVASVAERFVAHWPRLPAIVGTRDNCFGAEISTLAVMQARGHFDPAADALTFVYSDTELGARAVAVLIRLLGHPDAWAMPEARLELIRVPDLRPRPRDPKQVDGSVARALRDSIRPDGETSGMVMSGGFKSIVPVVTLLALRYGPDLYYLFERTDKLRIIQLPVSRAVSGGPLGQVGHRLLAMEGSASVDEVVSFILLEDATPPEPRR